MTYKMQSVKLNSFYKGLNKIIFNIPGLLDVDCINSSYSDFPDDLFSISQKQNGAIVFHFILALYCFTVVAIVCNDYFLPAVDCICTG
jgi:hypothetical protein